VSDAIILSSLVHYTVHLSLLQEMRKKKKTYI